MQATENAHKVCATCAAPKPLDAFHKNSSKSDGRRNSCKECTYKQDSYNGNRFRRKNGARHSEAYYAAALADEANMLNCRTCKQPKHAREFSRDASRRDGFNGECKPCVAMRVKNRNYRSKHLRRTYGITEDQYQMLLDAQGGVCAICGEPPRTRRLAVDHCHKGGHVRGLLCSHCNGAIGMLKDDPVIANKAVEYLLRF